MKMRNFVFVAATVCLTLAAMPTVVHGNPAAAARARAAAAAAQRLTDQVMNTLEPRIAEMIDGSPIAPAAKPEVSRQLTDAAERLVKTQVEGAVGGRLPNPAQLANQVVGELRTVLNNLIAANADGTLMAGGNVGNADTGAGDVVAIQQDLSTAHNQPTVQTAVQPIAQPIVQPPPPEQRAVIAVYATGHTDPAVNAVLGIDILRGLVRTERYRETERHEDFIAAVNAGQMQGRTRIPFTESRIIELAKEFGAERLCVVNLQSVLGSYYISARIVNTETGEMVRNRNGETTSALESMDEIRTASADIVRAIADVPAPPPIVAAAPPPVYAPQYAEVETPISTDAEFDAAVQSDVKQFFTVRYMPPTNTSILQLGVDANQGFGLNLEYGRIRENGRFWSVDFGIGTIDMRHYSEFNIGAGVSWGPVIDFANKVSVAYGTSVGFWLNYEEPSESITTGFAGPILKFNLGHTEITYRGLLGIGGPKNHVTLCYTNQLMVGVRFGGR